MKFIREEKVRFGHCDPAAIVYYPQYAIMLNTLVEDWFDHGLGMAYSDVVNHRRLGLPTVRLEVDFTAVSRLGDVLRQELGLKQLGRSSLHVGFEFFCGDELRLRARQVLVCTSLEDHRPRALPDDIRQAMQRYTEGEAVR